MTRSSKHFSPWTFESTNFQPMRFSANEFFIQWDFQPMNFQPTNFSAYERFSEWDFQPMKCLRMRFSAHELFSQWEFQPMNFQRMKFSILELFSPSLYMPIVSGWFFSLLNFLINSSCCQNSTRAYKIIWFDYNRSHSFKSMPSIVYICWHLVASAESS